MYIFFLSSNVVKISRSNWTQTHEHPSTSIEIQNMCKTVWKNWYNLTYMSTAMSILKYNGKNITPTNNPAHKQNSRKKLLISFYSFYLEEFLYEKVFGCEFVCCLWSPIRLTLSKFDALSPKNTNFIVYIEIWNKRGIFWHVINLFYVY